jgi:hypothetical protein
VGLRRHTRDELDRELTKLMARPSRSFARTLAAHVEARARPRLSAARLAFVTAFTASMAAGVAVAGGFGYAATTSEQLVDGVARVAKKQEARTIVRNSPAQQQYGQHCNSGRGNLSETETGNRQTNSDTLVNPHEGGRGPGPHPTDDCDPGNSGSHNRGGD